MGDNDQTATYSTRHPHEPEIPPALDPEGRCLVCGLLCERDDLLAALARVEQERDEALHNAADLREHLALVPQTLAHVRDLEAALAPFSEFATHNVDEHGWKFGRGCQNERIVDWFGPSDFRAALRAVPAPEEETGR